MSDLVDFETAFSHIQKLLDRRQSTTSFYLSVNTVVLAVIGLLLKDAQLTGVWWAVSILALLGAGVLVCWIWRSLLYQYETLLDWWYTRLRELEAADPESAKLITREYEDLYVQTKEVGSARQQIGMTERELILNTIFIALYGAFAIGILLTWII